MQILFDLSPLMTLSNQMGQAVSGVRQKAQSSLRSVTEETITHMKDVMPVLTGRAKSSWGRWTSHMVLANPEANEGDAILEDNSEADLSITHGSAVPYMELLNAGHSKKAPPGFVDMAAEIAADTLEAAVDRAVAEVL